MKRRTQAFKDRVVAEVLAGMPQAQVARKYNVHANAVYNWKKAYLARNGKPKLKEATLKIKVSSLELALKKALDDAEILRRAIAIVNKQ